MFAYQLRLALKSLKRNPVLSTLIVGGIGLGIAVSMTFVTAYHVLSGDPIPHKSDRLFYVQVDAWNPERPWDDDNPSEPPDQLTYMDAMALVKSDIPTHQAVMHVAAMTVHPATEGLRPYRKRIRMTHAGFFALFDVPFAYGSGWDASADLGPEPVIVIDGETNQKLFGGENSVGRTLRIEDRDFRISGVLAHWNPTPKFYDPHNGPFDPPEQIFMPFRFGAEFEIHTSGNTSGWKPWGGSGYAARLASESIWLQMWVQLDTTEQKQAYMAFLDAYANEQKALGRFGRPLNNRLRNVPEWLTLIEVLPPEARALTIIALLFLLVCSVNLIGILLGKFLARAPEIGVRRALGASRRWIFTQHLTECLLVGLLGGAIGLGISVFGVRFLDRLFDTNLGFGLDPTMLGAAMALSLFSALVAGVYPAWRICRTPAAIHLKAQ